MSTTVVVGGQWGDEGKGKIVDLLSQSAQHVVRCQGGANAGHTVVVGKEEFKLHLVPTGILHPHVQCYLGAGVVIDPESLVKELEGLSAVDVDFQDRLWISPYAHVVMPYHKEQDVRQEQHRGETVIGTTNRGIGPCYADKASRGGYRIADVLEPEFSQCIKETVPSNALASLLRAIERLRPLVIDVEERLFFARQRQEEILLEGAQGALLDGTFGTYPYVTSSSTCSAGVCQGAGFGPCSIDQTLIVLKAYCTRVGHGPFPTEDSTIFDQACSDIREVGTTTGRERRLGWFDATLARWAIQLNGADNIALTKLDILDQLEKIKICVGYTIEGCSTSRPPVTAMQWKTAKPIYEEHPGWRQTTSGVTHFEDLPQAAQSYIARISELCLTPVALVSVGPARDQTLMRQTDLQEAT